MKFTILTLLSTLLIFPSIILADGDKNPKHFVGHWKKILPPLEQGEKWTKNDDKYGQKVMDFMRVNLLDMTKKGDTPKTMKRDTHSKHHGCLRAKITFNNEKLPLKYRLGLFSNKLNNRTFSSIVRFSNGIGTGKIKHDGEKDARAMALKVLGLPTTNFLTQKGLESTPGEQDFLTGNGPIFLTKSPKQFLAGIKASRIGGFQKIKFLINPMNWGQISKLGRILIKIGNPLHLNYFSQAPYKLGQTSMKFQFKSCVPEKKWQKVPKKAPRDYLKNRLAASLKNNDACFDMLIQPNLNPKKMPIEDLTKTWKEKYSPFIKVARITIPKQIDFISPNQWNKCEKMSYNPWRTLPIHRPMGAVNRLRLMVYGNQNKMRMDYNKK